LQHVTRPLPGAVSQPFLPLGQHLALPPKPTHVWLAVLQQRPVRGSQQREPLAQHLRPQGVWPGSHWAQMPRRGLTHFWLRPRQQLSPQRVAPRGHFGMQMRWPPRWPGRNAVMHSCPLAQHSPSHSVSPAAQMSTQTAPRKQYWLGRQQFPARPHHGRPSGGHATCLSQSPEPVVVQLT
jgi:hypothetical protein